MSTQLTLSISEFLFTYLIHSSIFITAALIALRFKKLRSDDKGEYLLKLAIILGIFTAGLQHSKLIFGTTSNQPMNFQWQLSVNTDVTDQNASVDAKNKVFNENHENEPHRVDQLPKHKASENKVIQPRPPVKSNGKQSKNKTIPTLETTPSSLWNSWPLILCILWLTCVVYSLAKKLYQWHLLDHLLKQRTEVKDNNTNVIFTQLLQQASLKQNVTLSESEFIDSPIAFTSGEVILPKGFHLEFSPDHTKAALAHELAHIKRYDGYWLWFSLLIESVLFLQPLNRIINGQIYQLAEQRSDAMAAQWIGNPRILAEALSEVAQKKFINTPIQMVPTMTSKKSNIRIRIEHLLLIEKTHTTFLSIIFSAALLILVLMAAPGISIKNVHAGLAHDNHVNVQVTRKGRHEISMSSSNDQRTMKLKAKLTDAFEFNLAETEITDFPTDNRLDFSVEENGVKRRLEVINKDNQPLYTYYINDKKSSYDQSAQDWFASYIPEILRMTGLNAKARVTRIRNSGGDGAVLDEVDLISSDYVQALYLDLLFELTQLSAVDVSRVINQTRNIASDYEQSNVMAALVDTHQINSETQWIDLLKATESMGSDFEHAKTLINFIKKIPQTIDVNESFFSAAKKIGSDFELRNVLSAFLNNKQKQSDHILQMFKAARSIGSDFELAGLLIESSALIPQSEELFYAYISLTKSIGSDFELKRVYSHLLKHDISATHIQKLIKSAQSSIGSDFELSNLLQELIEEHPLNDEQILSVKQAANSINSNFEKNKVLSKLMEKI